MAIITNERADAGVSQNQSTGRIVTDGGAAAALTIQLGFAPRVIRFHNLTDRISDEWFVGMANASSLHTIATGVRTLEVANGITVAGHSFTVNANTMLASKTFVWEAES